MNAPRCPSCRERLSDAEAGLVGVWGCLYCEGAWFSRAEPSPVRFDSAADDEASTLVCPGCEGTGFDTLRKAELSAYRCRGCTSTFIPRRTVLALGDALGGGRWRFGDALAVLVGRDTATKTEAALVVGGLLALLFAP